MATYRSDAWGDTLEGTVANDLFIIGRGPDVVTGGGGADVFTWSAPPAVAGRITDYSPSDDKLDFSNFYAGDAVAVGRLTFESDGQGNTRVVFDRDGAGGEWPIHFTTIVGVAPEAMYAQYAGDTSPVLPEFIVVAAAEARMPGGSNGETQTTFTSGVTLRSEDGFDDITVGGITVVRDGALVDNSQDVLGGVLSVTGFDAATGWLDFTFRISTAYDHEEPLNQNVVEVLPLTVSDADGDVSTASVRVTVADDAPRILPDNTTLDAKSGAPVTGNVLTNDRMGLDGGALSKVESVGRPSQIDTTFEGGELVVEGLYGTLHLRADGSYTYERADEFAYGIRDQFRYMVTDGDGDEAPGFLGVYLSYPSDASGKANLSVVAGSVDLSEASLPNGSAPNAALTTQSSTIVVKAADGIGDVRVGGHLVIDDGVFTATTFTTRRGDEVSIDYWDPGSGQLDFHYTLKSAFTEGPDWSAADYRLGVELTDTTGAKVYGGATIYVRDDGPKPADDRDTVAPGATATGNVITDASAGDAGDADTGADRLSADGGFVVSVNSLTNSSSTSGDRDDYRVNGAGDYVVEGAYGTLTLNANGAYTYVAHAGAPSGVTDEFRYNLADIDGGFEAARLYIQISGGGQTGPSEIAFTGEYPSAREGTGTGGVMTFQVARSGDTSQAASVNWAVSDGGYNVSASPNDFAGGAYPSGVITFQPGQSIATLTVQIAGDSVQEGSESFGVVLSNAQGASLGASFRGGTIFDDDSGSPPPPPPPSGGQVYTSPGPGSAVTGGAGNDTINASQGSDILTGGAGDDVFAWAKEPWSPARVTDFSLGHDTLDFSKLFAAAGYTGSNPVADRYVSFLDDGAGGTKVLFDRDGAAAGQQWPNYILQLEHVPTSGLTWAQLAGDSEPPPPPPPPPSPPPLQDDEAPADGQVINSPGPGSTLTGGAGDDTLNASRGPDTLTGGGGADHFVFADENWAPATITDFASGTDKIDFRGVLDDWGYAGTDPIADGHVILVADSAGTKVLLDHDGAGGDWGNYVLLIQGVQPSGLAASDWLFQ